MNWLEWSDAAFDAARAAEKPVLLLVRASWCRFSRELEERVLADPRVARLAAERFVAIRVDKDRRPDIDVRYARGGWPTLAYLDDQGELLASDAFLEADDLVVRLSMVAEQYARNRESIRARIAELDRARRASTATAQERAPKLSADIVDHVARTVVESADPRWGGWGREHKFPHAESVDFLLVRWAQTGDETTLATVLRTLRCVQEGEIHDRVEGGFYRYATQPDWSVPHHEKMLDSNAQRLVNYLEAWQLTGDDEFLATARGVLRFLETTLRDPRTGAYKGSQDADPAYAHLATVAARREHGSPACDPTIFASWNAMAVSALLKASTVLGERELEERALTTLRFLCAELFDPAVGMYHYYDGTYHLPGLLADQAYVLKALVDAAQHAGDARWLATAKKLADVSIERLHAERGGFFDTSHDPRARGGLRHRNLSILENAVMAEALLRLSILLRDPDYADTARETLASFAGDYKRYGHFVAGYARAVDLLFHPPIHVTVVGSRGSAATEQLVRAALRPYVQSRIVQALDPDLDAELFARAGLPRPEPGSARAYVARGRESYAETSDPARIAALMTRIERGS